MKESKKEIVLNLSRSDTGLVNNAESLVQRDGQQRLQRIIERQLLQIEEIASKSSLIQASRTGSELSYSRPHNAILIEGGRGSGKTTFLLNCLDALDRASGDFAAVGKKLKVLPILDPTLIETKQNIIVVILSMIDEAVLHCADEDAALENARQDLAEGLSLLDGIGQASAYGAEWEDASWVMSRGLEKARKGHSFERKLNIYLEKALALLKVDAFVLAFDDVDTNFSHGFTILETIRKYLTSPRLILMLSGDLELYGRLLRRNIYRTFGERVLRHDISILEKSKQDVAGTILELEEQYLLKVLPPQNRIAMLPLGGLIERYDIQLDDAEPDGKGRGREPVAQWASIRIREQLLETSTERGVHPFFDFVSMEHMRMVIGYLRALQVGPGSASKFNVEVDSRKAVLTVFEARLRANGLPPDIIDRGSFDYTLRTAFEWFSRQDDAPELLQFSIPADRNKAVGLHCLGLALASFLSNSPGSSLRALFALGLPLAMMRRPDLSERTIRASITGYLWSQSAPSTPELAARLGAIDRLPQDVAKASASSFGSVGVVNKLTREELLKRLYGLPKAMSQPTVAALAAALKEKQKQRWITALIDAGGSNLEFAHGVTWFSIDELTGDDRIGGFGGYLSLAVVRRFTQRGEVNRTLSALSLFAAIAQMILDPDGDIPDAYTFSSIVPALRNTNAQIGKNDQTPDVEDSTESDNLEHDTSISAQDDDFNVFCAKMNAWRTFSQIISDGAGMSPATIGKISLRLHDDLLALDEKVPSTWKTGEILHRQITNILHVVVSLTSEHMGRKESPKSSDKPLIDILSPSRGTSLHPMAVILLSCPLVWAYLEPSEFGQPNANAHRLHRNVREILELWQKSRPTEAKSSETSSVRFDSAWMDPPRIKVLARSKQSKAAGTTVEINGFYDLLNVVPRYV
ncbi:hypothetical protein [Stenotrophomonas rhizophila]|uniref:Uncharacterized protein n=1 Tax=Stenotrophomonas rhizophila TaxID=216778 RepID=A0A7V7YKJ1_9GAMM|nr:hypothetical protein [Stenotrophomonas rhizophila]KAB7632962.1 hypothetical protein F9K92_00160 [Stenotrophomonas rhizophila]